MITLEVVVLALVHIALLVVMGSTLVSIMNNDIKFTDDPRLTWDSAAAKRAMVKGGVCFVAFCAYLFLITTFKFIG
jgi:hypothetical protein